MKSFQTEPHSKRLLINMRGYEFNTSWSKKMEDAICEAKNVILGDYQCAIKNIEELLGLIEAFDKVEKRDYKDRISHYIDLKTQLLSEQSTQLLTAQDICESILSKKLIEYYRKEASNLQFKTPINKNKTKFYESRPFGLPRKTIRNWVIREFGLNYSNQQFIKGEYNKYYPYTKRARVFSLQNQKSLGRLKIANSIMILKNNKWIYKNPHNKSIELMYSIDSNWMYPHPKTIDAVWTLINDLYLSIQNTNNINEIIGYTAQIHWLMAQSKIYRRSNASIADMFTKSILDAKGISTPNWRKPESNRYTNQNKNSEKFINEYGVSPDLEAFVTNLDQFIIDYEYFMEESPYWITKPENKS